MITGFNTNVRHRGRTFHVQTEDSGRAHPHVISHVYCGGTILASEKRGYSEFLDDADLDIRVRALMEGQHQALCARLRRGDLDALIDERLAGGAARPAPPPDPEVDDTLPPPAAAEPESEPPRAPAPAAASARGFGAGLDAQRPLDEVILEYLVDKARSRPPRAGERAARGSRGKG
jgi:hypothetical protein